jgi:uncharacterized protein (DUF58 family)
MPNRRNAVYFFIICALLLGLFTGKALFFSLAYLLGGLLIIAFLWSWFAVRGVAISRKTRTTRAQVGRNLEEAFTIRNRFWLPKLWLEVRDSSNLPGHKASHVVPALGGRGSYRWYVDTPCIVRGAFTLGPMRVVSGDPFGLFNNVGKDGRTSRLIVYPQTLPITRVELPAGILSGGEPRRQRAQTITTNAAGVREYVSGDSFNRIHWASSARKDRLMVKEFEIDPLADIWLFVDFSAQSLVEESYLKRINGDGAVVPRGTGIPPSSEEYAVVIAASLANHFIDAKRALGFTAYIPHREVYQPERGHRQLLHILESLAVARSLAPYSLAQMLSLETPYMTRGTTLIIITASLDPTWISEAQILSRRGVRPITVLLDPPSFGGDGNSEEFRNMLRLAKIPSMLIKRGDDLTATLGQHPI